MLYFGLVSSLGRDQGRKPLEIASESTKIPAQNCPLERDCSSVCSLSAAFGELSAAAKGWRGGRGLGQSYGWLAGVLASERESGIGERERESLKKKHNKQQPAA